ncbi:unnamed protein product [Rangifer tarandus platyrhynchus]|uniref:Uncharacterized protein n=2 Tax=Rangifer tarandus platyrhynchus TaxID=3082113 RepID=A0ABN8ZC62_RANTA|nr:unnamed protein product [Rangifer tarandus platyrhynchus]CAI9706017.1 unnamed protein product [Rangifer tarandus platyrhynchus]
MLAAPFNKLMQFTDAFLVDPLSSVFGQLAGRLTSVISNARPWPLTRGRKMDLRKQPQQSGEKLHFQIGQHFCPSGHPLHQGRWDAGSEISTAPRNPPNPPLTWSGLWLKARVDCESGRQSVSQTRGSGNPQEERSLGAFSARSPPRLRTGLGSAL